jgi:hypothetical protein
LSMFCEKRSSLSYMEARPLCMKRLQG